jgi:uncharacterized protein (DUF2147 family)
LCTKVVTSWTKKSRSNISIESICYHQYQSLTTSPIQKCVMKHENFWHKAIIVNNPKKLENRVYDLSIRLSDVYKLCTKGCFLAFLYKNNHFYRIFC